MGFQLCFKFFLIAMILNNSLGDDGCTPFSPKNLASINETLLSSLIDPVKHMIPIFNESMIPNLEEFMEQFNAASKNENIFLNITQILTKYGYESEQHTVETSDGYLIDMFRIPGKGPVVFVMPGMLCSSEVYISTGPEVGLAYQLADLGYDVWLANFRGSMHGRRHVTLSPDCREFWQFSWDESGRFDLPAQIDYVLENTGRQKLAYIGHSQGTTIYFVMASKLPQYNDKISVMIALSAVSYLSHTHNALLHILSEAVNFEELVFDAIGLYEFAPRNQITTALTTIGCGTAVTAKIICYSLSTPFTASDYGQLNAKILPPFFAHYPAGGSANQIIHFAQLIDSGRFCQMDHGTVGNLVKYGTVTPPDYPLEKITSKIVIFNGDKDYYYSAPEDREKLVARLPNVKEYRVPYDEFTHFDFLYAKDVRELVYNKVVDVLSKYV